MALQNPPHPHVFIRHLSRSPLQDTSLCSKVKLPQNIPTRVRICACVPEYANDLSCTSMQKMYPSGPDFFRYLHPAALRCACRPMLSAASAFARPLRTSMIMKPCVHTPQLWMYIYFRGVFGRTRYDSTNVATALLAAIFLALFHTCLPSLLFSGSRTRPRGAPPLTTFLV